MKIVDFDHEQLTWLKVGDEQSEDCNYVKEGKAVSIEVIHVTVEPRDGKPFPVLCYTDDGKPLLDAANMPERLVVEIPDGVTALGMFTAYMHRYMDYRKTVT